MTFENVQKRSLRHWWHDTHTAAAAAAGVEWNPLVSRNGWTPEAGRALRGHLCAHCLCSLGPCLCSGLSQVRPFVCQTPGGGSKDQCAQLVWQTTREPWWQFLPSTFFINLLTAHKAHCGFPHVKFVHSLSQQHHPVSLDPSYSGLCLLLLLVYDPLHLCPTFIFLSLIAFI